MPGQIPGWSPLAKSWGKDVWRFIWEKLIPAKSYRIEGQALAKGKALGFLGKHWHGRRKQANLADMCFNNTASAIIVHVFEGQVEVGGNRGLS